ncbi:MAG: hypothetical protein JWN30_2439 [Bacilli bacterium]|nr:hypothetical protein [Bacilli bacterium]
MERNLLDGALFLRMVALGHRRLEANKEAVNALNVFPVPDGDTGTNMSLSLGAGVEELKRAAGEPLGRMAESLSKGLLMGARGNSGVILSQLMRGFAKTVSRLDEVDGKGFAEALQQGVQTAYQAVVKPVEGTILTVAKDAARGAAARAKTGNASLVDVMQAALIEAEASLARTPDILPVLKQAKVVDSGGQGLVFVYQGFLSALSNAVAAMETSLSSADNFDAPSYPIPHGAPAAAVYAASMQEQLSHDGEFGYCTEFIVRVKHPSTENEMEQKMRHAMLAHGDSLLVVAADDLVKVHLHSDNPGRVLETALTFGPLIKIKIDNMTEQSHHLSTNYGNTGSEESISELPAELIARSVAMVAVASGDGLQEIFTSIGVATVISGGQTQNPSTEDLMTAVEATGAAHVLLLPNNSNIVMAANQASELAPGKVTVIPTSSIPQGLSAALAFDPEDSIEVNRIRMEEAIKRIGSAQVTRAVRTTQFQEHDIALGDYLGLSEGSLVAVTADLSDCLSQLFDSILSETSEIVTLFYGDELSEAEAEGQIRTVQERFPSCEFEMHYGGQPLYPFLISVE